jgi:hypothetical protein
MKAHVLLLLACLTNACATASLPAETALSAAPVTLRVPRDLEGGQEAWRGVHLEAIDRTQEQEDLLPGLHSTNNPIRDFFSVSFTRVAGDLVTRICRGEQYSDGARKGSCVFYDAHVELLEEPDAFRFTITPWRKRTEQGRNAIFVPIDLPKVELGDWYRYVTHQSAATHHKITSKFGPESIKGNFDRRLSRHDFGEAEANGALRQFKDTYLFERKDGSSARVGAAFYPYRDGSLVELYILGSTPGEPSASSRDWSALMSAVKSELDAIATE